MELLVRLIIAVLVGLIAAWVAGLFLPHSIAVLVGLLLGVLVFWRGDTLITRV